MKKKYNKQWTINWRKKNPEKYKAISAQWRNNNRDKLNFYAKKYRENNKDKVKAYFKNYYEKNREIILIKAKKYNKLNGYPSSKLRVKKRETLAGRPKPDKCDICNKEHKKICFDHCHKSGKFRGWICSNCNSALGYAKENIEILKSLILYLGKTNEQ